jgi:hypothetical protein
MQLGLGRSEAGIAASGALRLAPVPCRQRCGRRALRPATRPEAAISLSAEPKGKLHITEPPP